MKQILKGVLIGSVIMSQLSLQAAESLLDQFNKAFNNFQTTQSIEQGLEAIRIHGAMHDKKLKAYWDAADRSLKSKGYTDIYALIARVEQIPIETKVKDARMALDLRRKELDLMITNKEARVSDIRDAAGRVKGFVSQASLSADDRRDLQAAISRAESHAADLEREAASLLKRAAEAQAEIAARNDQGRVAVYAAQRMVKSNPVLAGQLKELVDGINAVIRGDQQAVSNVAAAAKDPSADMVEEAKDVVEAVKDEGAAVAEVVKAAEEAARQPDPAKANALLQGAMKRWKARWDAAKAKVADNALAAPIVEAAEAPTPTAPPVEVMPVPAPTPGYAPQRGSDIALAKGFLKKAQLRPAQLEGAMNVITRLRTYGDQETADLANQLNAKYLADQAAAAAPPAVPVAVHPPMGHGPAVVPVAHAPAAGNKYAGMTTQQLGAAVNDIPTDPVEKEALRQAISTKANELQKTDVITSEALESLLPLFV